MGILELMKSSFKVSPTQASDLCTRASQICSGRESRPQAMANERAGVSGENSVIISATAKSPQPALSTLADQNGTGLKPVRSSTATRNPEYPVADLVGRCFLRVCFWVDICTSWTKKYHPPEFTTREARPLQVAAPPALMATPAIQMQSTVAGTSQTTI